MKNRLLLIFLLCFFATLVFSQSALKTDSLLVVLNSQKEDTAKVNTLLALANDIYYDDFDSAGYFNSMALSLAIRLNYPIGIMGANLLKAYLAYDSGNKQEALQICSDLLKLGEQLLDSEDDDALKKIQDKMGEILNLIGIANDDLGNYPEALKNYFASLEIRKKIGDRKGAAGTLNNIGNICQNQGNYPEALKYFFNALKINEEIGNKKWKAVNLHNIGAIYQNQHDYPEALKNLLAALEIYREVGDKHGMAGSYHEIANNYYYQDKYEEALTNYFAALKINEEIGNKEWKSANLTNIGAVYRDLKNYPEALKYQFSSLKICEENKDKVGIAATLFTIGKIYSDQDQNKLAYKYISEALLNAKEVGYNDFIKNCYKGLADLDSARGNYKLALEHYKLFITYRDSMFNEENTKKTVRAQMQYEFDRKEALAKLEQERIARKHYLQYNAIIIVIVLVFIILIMLGSFKVPEFIIKSMSFFAFIFLFEFIILVADHKIHEMTHGEPWKMLAIKIFLIGFLLPFHHWVEKRMIRILLNPNFMKISGIPVKGKISFSSTKSKQKA